MSREAKEGVAAISGDEKRLQSSKLIVKTTCSKK